MKKKKKNQNKPMEKVETKDSKVEMVETEATEIEVDTKNTEIEMVETKSPEYSDEDIKLFLEECGKKPTFTQSDLKSVLKKDEKDLTYKDIRILFDKAGQLSDDERFKFRGVLIFENLTDAERERYTRIYPSSHKLDKYFPKQANVEGLYENHFLVN